MDNLTKIKGEPLGIHKNFAYNYVENLSTLQDTLIGQFVKDGIIHLEVHMDEENETYSRVYRDAETKELKCVIEETPYGIHYYEYKTNHDKSKNNKSLHSDI